MFVSALFAALIGSAAWAQTPEPCVPVEPAWFDRAAQTGRDYLRTDAVLAFESLVAETQAGLPCLTGPVSTASLASLLFDAAIVADARNQPVQAYLEAIHQMAPESLGELRARTGRQTLKGASLGDVKATWAAPKGADGKMWLDGAALPKSFHLEGPHVLQAVVDGVWRSAWVIDGVPPTWWGTGAKGKKGLPRPLRRRPARGRKRRSLLSVVAVGALLSGCRVLHVEARALGDVNDGQPIALHVHQLGKLPGGLPALGCSELRPSPEPPAWAADRLGEPSVVSALPGQRTSVQISHMLPAKWLLVTPEWSDCSDADGWGLVKLSPFTKRVRFEFTGRDIVLPWDRAVPPDGGKRWKQKGYVDGQPSHVSFRAPRAMR